MAEQEVIKHTKKIYKIWHSKEHSLVHKIKEFVIEIFIIVFAVTLSIQFHDYSEHQHERKEAREFLAGLKDDLQHDIKEINGDKRDYRQKMLFVNYIAKSKISAPLSADSINKYRATIYTSTGLLPNNGRFDGFKSSGKIGTIENKELQNDIMDFYQEDIVILVNETSNYKNNQTEMYSYISKNKKRLKDNGDNLAVILGTDEARNLAQNLSGAAFIIRDYDACIRKAEKIIAEIDRDKL